MPSSAVDYLARQLGLEGAEGSRFEVVGRTAERHRTHIRDLLGFRVFSRGDEDNMISWLAGEVCPSELNEDRQREAILAGPVPLGEAGAARPGGSHHRCGEPGG